jgi:hypothetical protein
MCVITAAVAATTTAGLIATIAADVAITAAVAGGVVGMVSSIQQSDAAKKQAKYQAEVAEAYDTLADELRKVIRKAVQKLSWNWRGVVPCYNPSLAQPCFLLPVSFCDSNKPDRALIATAERPEGESPVYTIHTVIPLNWAYLNARLVCRPESEWLGTEVINMGADDDDDETEEI